MSNCSNCFNGCTEIVSDKCVKYTGINIPALGIETGDTLASVEQAITTYLISVLNGSGVIIDLTGIEVCNVVNKYLPVCSTCTEVSIEDISTALIEASCDLQEQIDAIVADIVLVSDELDIINADYTVGCLIETTPSITPSSGTHAILQATINALCSLALELRNQYSSNGTELDNYIANYIANNTPNSSKYYTRMVPYVAVEFYPTNAILANFSGSGVGSGDWEKIYFCNGLNQTPDKRGVVGVGITDGNMGGGALPDDVSNSFSVFNPLYTLKGKGGTSNTTTLLLSQIPQHSHTNSTAIDAGHTHNLPADLLKSGGTSTGLKTETNFYVSNVPSITSSAQANITLTIVPEGGNGAHSNVQVGLGCYYIMYIP